MPSCEVTAKVERRIHRIPVGGLEPLHTATLQCHCHPLLLEDGTTIHNAWDLREKDERQGRPTPGQPWVLILELQIVR